MEERKLSTALPRLVEQVSHRRKNQDQALTMFDLRVGIRDIRLSEIVDWSNADLEAVETHVSRFADDAPLDSVLSGAGDENLVECAGAATSYCAPSPFAWM